MNAGMPRRPEPELMDDPAQALAYAQADFSEPHNRFIQEFKTRFGGAFRGRVLDLGCGAADICIRFAAANPASTLLGIDGAEPMLALGRLAIERHGLAGRIELLRCRLPAADIPADRYDAVISNSLLHHLREPEVLWQSIRRHAAADGPVCVMDLLRPATEQQARRLVELHAADAPAILQRDFYHSLLAAYRPEEIEHQLAHAGMQALKVEVLDQHHLLVSGRLG